MGAQQSIREGKEKEAKLLADFDKRIRRYGWRGEDASNLIKDKAVYESAIKRRDASANVLFRRAEKLPDGSDHREKELEQRSLLHAASIWKHVAEFNETLNPSEKPPAWSEAKAKPHAATTLARAISNDLSAKGLELGKQTLPQYTQEKARGDTETEAGRAGYGMAPASAMSASSRRSIGAAKQVDALRGTITVRDGDTLPAQAAVMEQLGPVAPRVPRKRTQEEVDEFDRAAQPLTQEQRAQAAEDALNSGRGPK